MVLKLVALTAALLAATFVSQASAGTVTCIPSPLEIVFAVDVSSSLTRSDFANLKKFLQSMAEHLPIGASQTRPAVITFSTNVKVEIDLGDADDVQSFKNAIDAIPQYRGFTATGQAMQTARRTVFSKSRSGASKLLVVVTDGRANYPGTRAEALALVRAESAELRGQGVRIHAIGIGEIWLRDELVAIAGSEDFSMIHDFKGLKALVDSLVKSICTVQCDNVGSQSFAGQCFSGTQRIVHVTKEHNKQLNRCEKSITHEYKYCGNSHLCKDINVEVGDCVNGMRDIVTTWEEFDVKLQKCVMQRSVQKMDCKSIEECKEPVAEILYILDSSSSMSDNDWHLQLSFVHSMVANMKIGPGAIHVGVIVFGTQVWTDIELGSVKAKPALLQRIAGLQRRFNQFTNTAAAFRKARFDFTARARPGVTRIAILMTDGESTHYPQQTTAIEEAAKLESEGVVILVVGVGESIKKEELEAIATPPLSDHLFYATDFTKLMNWAGKISQETCESITPPDPSLCELPPKRVVSSCYNSLQKVTEIKYEYDALGRCTKKILSHTTSPCKVVCTDPINGNEYFEGETWKTECSSFVCTRPESQTAVFKPTEQQCSGSENRCYKTSTSQNFKCHDDRGRLYGHCNCLAKDGNPLLKVITADGNASP